MKTEVNPQDTNRAEAFELWMSSPMPMVTLTKTFDVSNLIMVSRRLDLILKKRLQRCIDWSQINKTDYLQAMQASVVNPSPIHSLLASALTDKINDRETFMKGIDYSYYYEQED